MDFQAHRGVSRECPENTLSAFVRACIQGYSYIELDPAFTKDKKIVILHDKTINRTARKSDGSEITEPIYISDITYESASSYDYGIYMSVKYKGERIPLLTDALSLAEKHGVTVKIDNKIKYFSDEEKKILFSTIRSSSANVAITCDTVIFAEEVASYFDCIEIHYDGEVTESVLKALASIKNIKRLTVWLPLETPKTSFVQIPYASKELASLVKKYARLGIWNLSTEEELNAAESFSADIIETEGSLKPKLNSGLLSDMHTHTYFSHDSKNIPAELYKKAAENSLYAVGFSDHCDVDFSDTRDIYIPLYNSAQTAKNLSESDNRSTLCLGGIEVAEPMWDLQGAFNVIGGYDFDFVIGSSHTVRFKNSSYTYSGTDFSKFSEDDLYGFMNAYFDELDELIEVYSFDILAHLTCPTRYIIGKYKIPFDITRFNSRIDKILCKIIKKGIALEINTSTFEYGFTMPSLELAKRYRELGGYLITIASDAHTLDRVGAHFPFVINKLKSFGFKNIFMYKNRHPIQCSIEPKNNI